MLEGLIGQCCLLSGNLVGTHLVEHRITPGEARPAWELPYSLPRAYRTTAKKGLDKMLEHGNSDASIISNCRLPLSSSRRWDFTNHQLSAAAKSDNHGWMN